MYRLRDAECLMDSQKNVLTTGDVAKICNVAPRTVSKWFDSGQLPGYLIPGSKDRRIPVEHLIRFMRAHGMPLNGLESGCRRVLVFDCDTGVGESIRGSLAQQGDYEVATASSAFDVGALAGAFRPHVLIVDVTLPDAAPQAVIRFARTSPDLQGVCLIGMAQGLTKADGQALLQEGFDAYLSKPFDLRSVIQLVEEKAATPSRSRP